TLSIQVRPDAMRGQVIGLRQLYLYISRGAANPDRAAISALVGTSIPEANMVTLTHVLARSLKCQIFLAAIEIKVANGCSRVRPSEERIGTDTHRSNKVNLVGTHPTSQGKRSSNLPICSLKLDVDRITRLARMVKCRQICLDGQGHSGN